MHLKVLRMEDFNGRGPFSNGHVDKILNKENMVDDPYWNIRIYPNPFNEKLVKDNENLSNWYCGVLGIELFFHWFPKHQMPMYEELQSFISVYNVNSDPTNIRIGSKQVLFRRDKSRIINKIKPTEWIYLSI